MPATVKRNAGEQAGCASAKLRQWRKLYGGSPERPERRVRLLVQWLLGQLVEQQEWLSGIWKQSELQWWRLRRQVERRFRKRPPRSRKRPGSRRRLVRPRRHDRVPFERSAIQERLALDGWLTIVTGFDEQAWFLGQQSWERPGRIEGLRIVEPLKTTDVRRSR